MTPNVIPICQTDDQPRYLPTLYICCQVSSIKKPYPTGVSLVIEACNPTRGNGGVAVHQKANVLNDLGERDLQPWQRLSDIIRIEIYLQRPHGLT